MKHYKNAAWTIRYFTRTKWISTSTPKSVQIGKCVVSRSAL